MSDQQFDEGRAESQPRKAWIAPRISEIAMHEVGASSPIPIPGPPQS